MCKITCKIPIRLFMGSVFNWHIYGPVFDIIKYIIIQPSSNFSRICTLQHSKFYSDPSTPESSSWASAIVNIHLGKLGSHFQMFLNSIFVVFEKSTLGNHIKTFLILVFHFCKILEKSSWKVSNCLFWNSPSSAVIVADAHSVINCYFRWLNLGWLETFDICDDLTCDIYLDLDTCCYEWWHALTWHEACYMWWLVI